MIQIHLAPRDPLSIEERIYPLAYSIGQDCDCQSYDLDIAKLWNGELDRYYAWISERTIAFWEERNNALGPNEQLHADGSISRNR